MAEEKKKRSGDKPWHPAKDEKTSPAADLNAGPTITVENGPNGSKRPSGDTPGGRPPKRPAKHPLPKLA
jgi:hypothetical protein